MNPSLYLGIETSGIVTGVAIIAGTEVRFEKTDASGRHNEFLLPLIDEALTAVRIGSLDPMRVDSTGFSVSQLSGIGVTIGPGMFTSLRVGLSTAKGLALPHSIPVKGISTLLALAASLRGDEDPILAVVDARKHQVYAALYQGSRPVSGPEVIGPESIGRLVDSVLEPGSAIHLAGNGGSLCLDHLANAGFRPSLTGLEYPSPVTVATLARDAITADGGDNIEELVPVYLRRTDAELKRETQS